MEQGSTRDVRVLALCKGGDFLAIKTININYKVCLATIVIAIMLTFLV